MGDASDKGSECEDMMMMSPERCGGSVPSDGGDGLIKTCADCGTSKTPLWRGGPAGPKSLCNACGIRSRKRRALLGLSAKDDKKPKKTTTTITTTTKDDTKPKKTATTITTTTKDDTKPKKTTITITTSTKDDTKPKKTSTTITTTTTSDGDSQKSGLTTIYRSDYMGDLCLKKRIMALGSEVIVQRPRSKVTKHRRRRSEEEKAAYLLMAISCGSVFA